MIARITPKFRSIKPSLRFYSNKDVLNILGIETSCDDTGAAVINSSGTILSNCLQSQSKLHVASGGISGQIAAELHRQSIRNVVEKAMRTSQVDFENLDGIAVTVTPGLILCLQAGMEYAKTICSTHKKPLIPVHHMEAHALMARLTENVKFPFLTLLISGGHCILAFVKSATKFYRLGETMDNSPGQLLDHMARRAKLQNLKECRGLVGGAALEKIASKGDPTAVPFTPKLLWKVKNCDFSFSGCLTLARKYIESQEQLLDLPPDEVLPNINDFCASVQWKVTQHLCQRLEYALLYADKKNLFLDSEKCVVISGGVASNKFIRNALKYVCDYYDCKIAFPAPEFCTDNGVMIAWNAIERLKENCPLIQPNELDSVIPIAKNKLGEDISKDVEQTLQDLSLTKFRVKLNKFLSQT